MRSAKRRPATVFMILVLFAGGCSSNQYVELREVPRDPIVERLKLSAFGHPGPSERTQAFLAQSGFQGAGQLDALLRHTQRIVVARQPADSGPEFRSRRILPASAAEELSDLLPRQRYRESLAALAELNYLGARQAESSDAALAQELYLDAARSAWQYLVSEPGGDVLPLNEAPHREVTELYNTASEAVLRLARRYQGWELGKSVQTPLTGRVLDFRIPHQSGWLRPDSLSEVGFVSDYELRNLRYRNITPGVGVPVIAVRKRPSSPTAEDEFYADGLSFPATIVLNFDEAGSDAGVAAGLSLYDTHTSEGMVLRESWVPLETDLSTPLAWYLSHPDFKLLDTWGLIRADRVSRVQGLYMSQPYDPDRIPVLMVHGLWSSPMTWMEMFNDLQKDPRIRERYQFWFYLYPTGDPMTYSAADLRSQLEQLRTTFDPDNADANLDRMVVVGHSMGGLIANLLVVDSGDRLWNRISDHPVQGVTEDPGIQRQLEQIFFFQPDPSVDRIVTIASPFGGSSMANRFTRWLSNSFIWLPSKTVELTGLISGHRDARSIARNLIPRTSIDSLSKHSPVLTLIRESDRSPRVEHHNVVGVSKGRDENSWTDGVVKFLSSHRPDADSEIRVPAGHSDVHRHQEAGEEIRRILLEHLDAETTPPGSW